MEGRSNKKPKWELIPYLKANESIPVLRTKHSLQTEKLANEGRLF